MFTLVTEKSKFFRVKRGQCAAEIEKTLQTPVSGVAFSGAIVEVKQNLRVYIARAGESYRSIALKTGVSENELKEINRFKPVYPTCKIFIPRKTKK